MPTNDFLVFDENHSGIMSQQDYAANDQRLSGVENGVADPALHNKLYLQASIMAAAIGSVITTDGACDASDDNVSALAAAIRQAIVAIAGGLDAEKVSKSGDTLTGALKSNYQYDQYQSVPGSGSMGVFSTTDVGGASIQNWNAVDGANNRRMLAVRRPEIQPDIADAVMLEARDSGVFTSYRMLHSGNTPVQYSTSPQNTGQKWIDGKRIFRVVKTFGVVAAGGTVSIDLGIDGTKIGQIISLRGMAGTESSNYMQSIPCVSANVAMIISCEVVSMQSSPKVEITMGSSRSANGGIVIVEYTMDNE